MLRRATLAITILAASALLIAYIMQYGFGLEPCRLCYWQRYPYMAVVAVGILSLIIHQLRAGLVIMSGLLLVGFGIAAYHAGIEVGIFELPAACSAAIGQSMADMMATLAKPPAQCDQPAFEMFGLTLSMWNALAALTMAGLALVSLRRSLSPAAKPQTA